MTPPLTFKSDTAAAEFYGMTRANWMKLKALGKKQSDPLPFTDPAEMPLWFDRRRADASRKHKTPETILSRAAEASDNAAPPTVAKSATVRPPKNGRPGKASPAPVEKPQPPPETIAAPSEAEATNDTLDTFFRRELERLSRQYGQQLSGNQVNASRQTKIEILNIADKLRAWEKDKEQIRKGEGYIPEDEVAQTASGFYSAWWRCFERSVKTAFGTDAAAADTVLQKVEDELQALIPPQFRP